MKEIRVKIHTHENDSYNELYKVIEGDTNQKYFARHTFGDGEWYFVSDPLGYCELDFSCPKDYIFIICDSNGNELFRDSNGEINNPFPTLENHAKQVWAECKQSKTARRDGLNDWLLSFMTPDKITKDMPCPAENWKTFWYDQTKRSIIKEFEHLGEPYCIYKITMKHRYCDCEWVEYMCGHKYLDEQYPNYVSYFGAMWDEKYIGPCYSSREARQIVIDVLHEIYTKNKYHLSLVRESRWGGVFETKMSFADAADYLIASNYDRIHVGNVVENERVNRTFYDDREAIKTDFDDVQWDYSTKLF